MGMGGKKLWPEVGVNRLAQNYTVKHSFSEELWNKEKPTWERKQTNLARQRPPQLGANDGDLGTQRESHQGSA